MSKSNFDDRKVKFQDGVIDVFSHAGAEVIWLENDGGCKGVCDRVETWAYTAKTDNKWCVYEFCYDLLLLDEMEKAIGKVKGKDAVIVLHVNGSHGPTYYQRYTEQHRHFVPDCQRSDIQNCSNKELVNTYDNTILATDYVVAEAIKRAKSLSGEWDSSVVYISDHGESLGEKGVYLHGMPYSLAPEEQTKVPWLLWLSGDKVKRDSVDLECLKAKAEKGGYSHDNLFDTLLGLMAVKTEVYKPELDVVAECRG
jgi:lipid A ethanolaminephosphotransferase